jgi:5-methylcytosine-specific restriction endonuclease McrA
MKFQIEQFHRDIPDDKLVADLRKVAADLNLHSVPTRVYDLHGTFRSSTLMERFGGWAEACSKAGLGMRQALKNPPEEELFKNLEQVWLKLGRQPRYRDMKKPISEFTMSPYLSRYDSWHAALNAFGTYINSEETPQSEDSIRDWKIEPTTKHRTPRAINNRLRVKVFVRDNHKCQICGRSPATHPTTLQVDHIKAYSKGGETVLENLQTLCFECNNGKSNLDLFVEQDSEEPDGKF